MVLRHLFDKEVHPREYPSDWVLTDSEYQRILEAAVRYSKPLGVDGASCWSGLEGVVDEFKIDDNTFRILTEGYVLFNGAVDAGLKPMAYSFLGLPLKKIQVRLDFKVWKKIGALSLYFTELTKNKAYSITVYKDEERNIYCDRDGKVDFSAPNINGTVYELYIYQSKSGVYSLNTAKVITDNSYLSTK